MPTIAAHIALSPADHALLLALSLLSLHLIWQLLALAGRRHQRRLELALCRRTELMLRHSTKAQQLLQQALGSEAATQLMHEERPTAKKFKMVTVLFADIQGFSRIADRIDAELLLDQLDQLYYRFDTVVKRYGIEKIKTIGDAYMCAGGIPHKNQTNPVEVVLVAHEMMQQLGQSGTSPWELRMGIDTGPVIAGMVGQTRLAYDIWGSTVNVASRMEAASRAGRINITENTYLLVRDFFDCECRGRIPTKHKGDMQMYFVNGIKPHLSEDGLGLRPNEQFFVELQLIRLADLEEQVFDMLERELPPGLHYHNLKHTIDVCNQVELIGRAEGVSREEMLLLRTAALLHDTGHLVDYDAHEAMSVGLARRLLPKHQYTPKQVERIAELIWATKLPSKPRNLLEMIMCDADLEYLGRPDYPPVAHALYRELHERGRVGSPEEWVQRQIQFIEAHQYFTATARRQCDDNKQKQLNSLKIK